MINLLKPPDYVRHQV